jgi:hypothetical protein
MRKPHEKSSEESSATVPRAGVQRNEAATAEPLRDLQQSAGNHAMLELLGAGVVQRKAKGSESAPAESGPTPAPAPATAKTLIVDDEAKDVAPGQMRKSEFLSQLRTEVCSTAEEALRGTMWSSMGCPYIDKWLNHYAAQPSSHLERALQKYAPETASARSAQDYIPLVTRRVRRGIEEWSSTGEVKDLPEEFAEGGMPGATVPGLMGALMSGVGSAISGMVSGAGKALSSLGSMLFKHREGAEAGSDADPEAVRSQLGSGQALDSSVQRRMQSAFGQDFAGVRVHTDRKARELSEGLNARAFTIGNDIAFSGEEYKPGTPVGDALIAHELAHVVQQGGSANGGAQHKGGAAYGSLEEDADRSAVGAVAKLWMGARGQLSEIGQNAMPRMRSGLRLQGCGGPEKKKPETPGKDGDKADVTKKPVVLSGDWETDVKTAQEALDEAMMLALVKKAVEPTHKVHAAGKNSTGKEDPKDYKKTPVVNFDINLEGKERFNSKKPVGPQPGHSFESGADAYAILGPRALNPASPLIALAYAEHELYHTTRHLGAAKSEKNHEDREIETWTVDFTNYFHRFLEIKKNRPTWGPLLDYYVDGSAEAKKEALAKLKTYYEKPPVADAKEAERVKEAMSLWVFKWKNREGEKNRHGKPLSKELINEMDKFVKPYSK